MFLLFPLTLNSVLYSGNLQSIATRSQAMETSYTHGQRGIIAQLHQLEDRLALLHANLQKVSSRTLSNSRTLSLEDRVTQLEERPPPPEPTLDTDIFEDITRQLGIFDQQIQAVENKTKDFLDFLDQKIDKCDKKVETYQNDYFEWLEQWKADNPRALHDFRTTMANQQKQIDHILQLLQQKGLSNSEPSRPSKPELVHFPKWRPRSPPAKRRAGSPRLHQSGAADD